MGTVAVIGILYKNFVIAHAAKQSRAVAQALVAS
jgi:hypothetical protein